MGRESAPFRLAEAPSCKTDEECVSDIIDEVSKFYISQLETRLWKDPSFPMLRRLAQALGVPMMERLG